MSKPYIAGLLTLLTVLSGVTYYTLNDKKHGLSTAEIYSEWIKWCDQYAKSYELEEIPVVFNNFKNNLEFITKTNNEKHSYKLGLNKFSDMTNEQFKAWVGHSILQNRPRHPKKIQFTAPPSTWNWFTKGAVTPIKNQGDCGSCWAFSTTGSLEGLNFIKNGKLLSFSEQQLVDCSQSYGNQGCDGGLMDDAFQYVEAEGIELESVYPYAGVDQTCQYNAKNVVFKNTGYTDVTADDSNALWSAVYQQPISVAIEADQPVFQSYTSGVIDDASCGTSLDHGVLAVGFNMGAKPKYWIVKNSWGADWGNNGFVWIANDDGPSGTAGICGINSMPSYPTL